MLWFRRKIAIHAKPKKEGKHSHDQAHDHKDDQAHDHKDDQAHNHKDDDSLFALCNELKPTKFVLALRHTIVAALCKSRCHASCTNKCNSVERNICNALTIWKS